MSLTPKEQEEVETALGLSVPPVTPSPELKSSIMAKIAATPQLPPITAESAGPATKRAEVRWFSKPVAALVAAAAAVILFAGGTVLGMGIAGDNAAQSEANTLAVLTSASDLQRATAPVSGGGVATLIWSLEQRKSAILVNHLPALPAGKTYQLWYIGGSGPVSAGTFEADAGATTWRVLDGAMSAGDTVGVTVEPAGGSTAPTTDPIVAIASS